MTVRALSHDEVIVELENVRDQVAASAAFLRRTGWENQYLRRHALDLEESVPRLDDVIGNLRVDRKAHATRTSS